MKLTRFRFIQILLRSGVYNVFRIHLCTFIFESGRKLHYNFGSNRIVRRVRMCSSLLVALGFLFYYIGLSTFFDKPDLCRQGLSNVNCFLKNGTAVATKASGKFLLSGL